MFTFISRASRRTLSLFITAAIIASPTVTWAQDPSTEGLPRPSYSYLTSDRERTEINFEDLAQEIADLEYDHTALFALQAPEEITALQENPVVQTLTDERNSAALQAIGAGLELGGMSSAAAIVMFTVASIGAQQCEKMGKVISGAPILGRSSMDAVQWAKSEDTGKGLGRGQFDIRSTKFVLCRDESNNAIDGIAINVRWVFNVNGDSLMTKQAPFQKTPGNKPYKQNFHAEGIGIQLVLLEIDGTEVQQQNPIYKIVEDACIDIWFVQEVDGFDISVPASLPTAGVFCAGGYCKDDPPGLDATQ